MSSLTLTIPLPFGIGLLLVVNSAGALDLLLAEGFLAEDDIVVRGVLVEPVGAGSGTFRISVGGVQRFVLKIPEEGGDAKPLKSEIDAWHFLASIDVGPEEGFQAPLAVNTEYPYLLSPIPADSSDLTDTLRRSGGSPGVVGDALGRSLRRLHENGRKATVGESPSLGTLSGAPKEIIPLALVLGEPPAEVVLEASMANSQLFSLYNSVPQLQSLGERSREQWESGAIIHGDAKLSNAVAHRAGSGRRRTASWFDLEMWGWGDPRWDVGLVVASTIRAWFATMPVVDGSLDGSRLDDVSEIPSGRLREFILRFLRGYSMSSSDEPQIFLNLLSHVPLALIQMAWEEGQTQQRIGLVASSCVNAAASLAEDMKPFVTEVLTVA